MLTGCKHLIKCRCILRQYMNVADPPQHHFIVFSIIEDDVLRPKYAQCNNCGVIHKVTDVCKSEIITGRESSNAIASIDDIRMSLPKRIGELLDAHDADLPTWENVQFIFDEQRWGEYVVLSVDNADPTLKQVKYVRILGENMFRVDTATTSSVLSST